MPSHCQPWTQLHRRLKPTKTISSGPGETADGPRNLGTQPDSAVISRQGIGGADEAAQRSSRVAHRRRRLCVVTAGRQDIDEADRKLEFSQMVCYTLGLVNLCGAGAPISERSGSLYPQRPPILLDGPSTTAWPNMGVSILPSTPRKLASSCGGRV